MVYVETGQDSMVGRITVFWFPNKQSCARALAAAVASGALPDDSDIN